MEGAIQNNENKAHGLNGNLEERDWPALEFGEIQLLLRRYPQAGEALRVVSHSPRPFSSASLVETSLDPIFIKRHSRKVRTSGELQEEHSYLEYLASALTEIEGQDSVYYVPLVQAPLRDTSGETAVSIGDWTYEIHPQAIGLDVYEHVISWQPFVSRRHAHAAGEALGHLHRAARGYLAPARRAQQLVTSFTIFAGPWHTNLSGLRIGANSPDSPLTRMQQYLDARPLLRRYAEDRNWQSDMQELFLPWYRELGPWLQYFESMWTHNDFHCSNMMWSGNDDDAFVTSIVDFGLADRTNAVHDLATAIERNIVEWLRMNDPSADLVHFDHLTALLGGYELHTPLNYEQARGLAAMLPLVHCEFALSEADYFLSVLHSEDKAFFAYEGYFIGHAQWFHSRQGKALLAWLREWAEEHPHESGGTR